MAFPGHFFIYFRLFQTNITIFTKNKCEKCSSSIWCWDSKPRSLKHESPPIPTRSGLPSSIIFICKEIDQIFSAKRPP